MFCNDTAKPNIYSKVSVSVSVSKKWYRHHQRLYTLAMYTCELLKNLTAAAAATTVHRNLWKFHATFAGHDMASTLAICFLHHCDGHENTRRWRV